MISPHAFHKSRGRLMVYSTPLRYFTALPMASRHGTACGFEIVVHVEDRIFHVRRPSSSDSCGTPSSSMRLRPGEDHRVRMVRVFSSSVNRSVRNSVSPRFWLSRFTSTVPRFSECNASPRAGKSICDESSCR